MIRALLFDVDNTLADRSAAFRRYSADFCRRRLAHRSPQEQIVAVAEMLAIDNSGYTPRDEFCADVVARFADCGLTATQMWHDHRDQLCEFYEPNVAVRQLVARLAAQYCMGIVSNGSQRNQRRKLERIGLADLVECIVISEEARVAKPDAAVFLAALDVLGCVPDEALFIGDDPYSDIAGASRAGLATCWVSLGRPFPIEFPAPDLVIPCLLDLEGVLPCLMPAR
ncbi:MAG TPA: HAD family hydrolase [Planctomycetaceae bacterium]|jgi:putative hydrolase of the HAD superfamily